jgi:4-carboxymuconolactone decarboxylase
MSTAATEAPVQDLLATMTAASVERSELDPRSLMLVRLAALAAVDAPPVSYLMNLAVASDVGVVAEDVEQVLIGIAPVVGTARVVSAGGKIARAWLRDRRRRGGVGARGGRGRRVSLELTDLVDPSGLQPGDLLAEQQLLGMAKRLPRCE